MVWVDLVTLLAVLQYFSLIYVVGKARQRFAIKAPAVTGNPEFERYIRVQQNTVETLLVFLPTFWIAARYFNPVWIAAIGVLYVIGRVVYHLSYVRDPGSRGIGYLLSVVPILVFTGAGLFGVLRTLAAG